MKADEIKFFRTCYKHCSRQLNGAFHNGKYHFRDIINICCEFINYKRCWYLLKKWERMGMYNYGTTLDLGWFTGVYSQRYYDLIKGDK